MRFNSKGLMALTISSVLLGGCAADSSGLLTTAAVPQQQAAPSVDPACLALENKIALLLADGTIGRVEKAAIGKSTSVMIKRAALAKVAELNQANAAYQTRCGAAKGSTTAQATGTATSAATRAQPKPTPVAATQ